MRFKDLAVGDYFQVHHNKEGFKSTIVYLKTNGDYSNALIADGYVREESSRPKFSPNDLVRKLKATFEPVPEPLLTDKEKTYLEAVIKPFKDKVKYIKKQHWTNSFENIVINTSYGWNGGDGLLMQFPAYTPGTMYAGMKPDHKYTLKELGLFEGKNGCNVEE